MSPRARLGRISARDPVQSVCALGAVARQRTSRAGSRLPKSAPEALKLAKRPSALRRIAVSFPAMERPVSCEA